MTKHSYRETLSLFRAGWDCCFPVSVNRDYVLEAEPISQTLQPRFLWKQGVK